jgi:hypothetical protein
VAILLMVINGYYISGYWFLLMAIILVTIGGYYIRAYIVGYYLVLY